MVGEAGDHASSASINVVGSWHDALKSGQRSSWKTLSESKSARFR